MALDVKTSLEKYEKLGAKNTSDFLHTVEILKIGKVAYEFRTTVVPGFVDAEDIARIGELVKGAEAFAFQQFVPDDAMDKRFAALKPYSPEIIGKYAESMKEYVGRLALRI